ncbi:MAG: anthranilate synthase component I family protein [Deltaproteobacteria bacterium]|nr:anthranilate synthase component I family protein [Deltaproteobacteria bacterium]
MGKSVSGILEDSARGGPVPLYREIPARGIDPSRAFARIAPSASAFLLESGEEKENGKRGRSIIGWDPFLIVSVYGDRIEIREGSETRKVQGVVDPLEVIRGLTARFQATISSCDPPFQGGLVGYVNYDLARKWEKLPGLRPWQGGGPECIFMACRKVLVFDHEKDKISALVFPFSGVERDGKSGLTEQMEEVEQVLLGPDPEKEAEEHSLRVSATELKPEISREKFYEMVRLAKEYIVSGDIIQVVLSVRFSGRVKGDDFLIYRALSDLNPSPYMFYLRFGTLRLIGASPEMLVQARGGHIRVRPIAGTRPRGSTPGEDLRLEEELLADPKERAEHVMLVDLGRNDVGRISEGGSVRVSPFMKVERYSHVMHIVSGVEGRLRSGKDSLEAFKACFPAGTVTGAPKIRAMEIISELESSSRGPYAGAVGYFGFDGDMDFCISIRTMVVDREKLLVQAGAGIVYDSVPEREYQECLNKAAALFKAVERVNDHDFPDR